MKNSSYLVYLPSNNTLEYKHSGEKKFHIYIVFFWTYSVLSDKKSSILK